MATPDRSSEVPDEMIDLDTVVVVDACGYDEDFTPRSHPGMMGYIVPGSRTVSGLPEMHIIIPIRWDTDDS